LTTRRIPNALTFGGALLALVYFAIVQGLSGVLWALGGWTVGLLIWMPLFVLRGLGGGDIKLLAAIGAWLGPALALWVALFAAVAGGVLALVVALYAGYLRTALSNVWGLLTFWRIAGLKPHPALSLDAPAGSAPRLPYAIAIAAGVVLTLWLK
jgi:prepilin peptidase CpaA